MKVNLRAMGYYLLSNRAAIQFQFCRNWMKGPETYNNWLLLNIVSEMQYSSVQLRSDVYTFGRLGGWGLVEDAVRWEPRGV
jgi:hypothetical protein